MAPDYFEILQFLSVKWDPFWTQAILCVLCYGAKGETWFFIYCDMSAFYLQNRWVVITHANHFTHRCNITALWWDPWFYTLCGCWIRSHFQLVWVLVWRWFNSWLNSRIPCEFLDSCGLWDNCEFIGFLIELLIAASVPVTCLNFINRCVDDPVAFGYLFLW